MCLTLYLCYNNTMDNMAYLQQISAPPAPKKTSLFSSLMDGPLFKILVALGVLAIIIIIVGIITGGGSSIFGFLLEL